mgnify:CR=1 FL=1|jgi:hypothetical protein
MFKFGKKILFIMFVALVVHFVFPWWAVIVAIAIILVLKDASNGVVAFFEGFLSLALLWLFTILFIELMNDSTISDKIAAMFELNSGWLLILLTVFLGGMLGGLGALTGYLLRQVLEKDDKWG